MSTSDIKQTKRDLRKAAAYMREHGRTAGALERRDGRCCPLGAIARVTIDGFDGCDCQPFSFETNPRAMRAVRRLAKTIQGRWKRGHGATIVVFMFNDKRPGQRYDGEIYSVMERAAQ